MSARRVSVLLCGSARVVRLDAVIDRAGAAPRAADRREAAVDGPPDWGAAWTAAVARAATELRDRRRVGEAVDLVVPSVLVLARAARCPRDAAARRRGALAAFAAGAAMPAALAETAWMHAVTGGDAAAHDLTVFAARAEAIETLLLGLEAGGFRPRSIWPTPLAFQVALPAALAAAATPQLALHLDATSAILWRLHRGRSWARSFRLPAASASAGVEERSAVVAREVRRTEVHFLRSGAEGAPEQLSLAGDAAADPAFAATLAGRLGIPATPLPSVEFQEFKLDAVEHGALVLAGRGADDSGLVPPARRAAREDRAAGRAWLLAGTLLAAALLVVALPLHFRAREQDDETRRLLRHVALRRSAVLELEAREQRVAALETEAARMERFLGHRTTWLAFLADLEERCFRLGDLRLERLEVEGGESTGEAEDTISVRLGGVARADAEEAAVLQVRALAADLARSAAVAAVGVPDIARIGAGARFDVRVVVRRAEGAAAESSGEEAGDDAMVGIETARSRARGARSGGDLAGVGDPSDTQGEGEAGVIDPSYRGNGSR